MDRMKFQISFMSYPLKVHGSDRTAWLAPYG
jgi:hypothetical protein